MRILSVCGCEVKSEDGVSTLRMRSSFSVNVICSLLSAMMIFGGSCLGGLMI